MLGDFQQTNQTNEHVKNKNIIVHQIQFSKITSTQNKVISISCESSDDTMQTLLQYKRLLIV